MEEITIYLACQNLQNVNYKTNIHCRLDSWTGGMDWNNERTGIDIFSFTYASGHHSEIGDRNNIEGERPGAAIIEPRNHEGQGYLLQALDIIQFAQEI